MDNRVLSYFVFSELDKFRSNTTTSNQDYNCYSRWVAGGECTVKTYGAIAPTIVVKDASGNTINGTLVDLANQTWDTTPSKVPTYAYHFEMPDSNVTITVQ